MEDPGVARGVGFDWEGAEDLTALSRGELASRLESLCEEERTLGYRLEILRGRIGLIRAELTGSSAALRPEELVRVLLGEASARGPESDDPALRIRRLS